ncbi:amidohydrolase [Oscillibacter sp. MSJ-2]|uniref:Amidohydrolase n=1 Tax=Dysosmobacter acutus TaxID=2841504 RepID=A0ABS6F675_9FIRM|nr:amidohydrolase [Dysosmobacter acutus]MBU5625662.1 amidohydrolase [Dysosmobacter acutus]
MSLVDDRRALHRIPELDCDLPETMAYLEKALSGLRCDLSSPCKGALCAYFDFGAPSAIAFRSDADALPITERSGVPFSSLHPGRMHACGHDGHMAILLELGRRLNGWKESDRNVLLVFQPSEETTGGARKICESGVFERCGVEAVFGLHLWPDLPAGTVASRRLEMMSRSCEVTAEFTGRSAHIARAEEGIDALDAAVLFYRRVRELVDSLPPQIYRLCRFGRMESGTVRNALSGRARIEGSLRTFQDEVFFDLLEGIRAIGRDVQAETGCGVAVTNSDGYPAVINPPELYDRIRTGCGVEFEELPRPVMITEDFSWYQKHLPGLFFFLGTGPSPALHADNFNFDEAVLSRGADLFESIARRYGGRAV